jgi:hypothetical protein
MPEVPRLAPAKSLDPDADTERQLALEELRRLSLLSRDEFAQETKHFVTQAAASKRRQT